jgi:predicted acetyltransferase
MATSYPVRPITEDELPGFRTVHEHAFHGRPQPERAQALWASRVEFDRTLGAFDGNTVVGAAGIFSFRMRVPGALIPVAGVTMVAVLPTHRRRGILSAFMRRQFEDLSHGGEGVAALFASEANIYGRFGYGPASSHAFYTMKGGEGALAATAPVDDRLRLRIADPAAARAALGKVYDMALAERPGFYARTDAWWDRVLDDPKDEWGPGTPLRCLLAEDDSGPRGYALFRAQGRWDDPTFLADSNLDVHEAIAIDPAATAAVWGDLLSRDLTTEFRAAMRPVDDPLIHLLADPRRLRRQVSDALWVRLVDVGRALGQRRYACPVDVVIEVVDEVCPQNQGRWRLTAGADTAADGREAATGLNPMGFGARCERAAAKADIVAPVQALGASYLGDTRLGALARAGLVTENRAGALANLSTALSWDPAPWCPLIF